MQVNKSAPCSLGAFILETGRQAITQEANKQEIISGESY